MMKKVLFLLITVSVALNAFGTAQMPDKIIYKGRTYNLYSNPLEGYFERYPDRRPSEGIVSTALWRGYIATFEVKDGRLMVMDVEAERFDGEAAGISYKYESVLDKVFPEGGDMTLDWFTGLLVIPHGKLKSYVHMGYASTYGKYILLEFDKGRLTAEKKFRSKEYERFKARQFEEFRKTEEYRRMKEELMAESGASEEFIDMFLRDFVISYSSKILTD